MKSITKLFDRKILKYIIKLQSTVKFALFQIKHFILSSRETTYLFIFFGMKYYIGYFGV